MALRRVILGSPVPEDPLHADSTLKWLTRLWPQAPLALRMAAYAHDIERAISPRRVKRVWFSDYERYKQVHALASAEIFRKLLLKAGLEPGFVAVAARAVAHHESGGYPAADLLSWADKLSFFETNLPLFARRTSLHELADRIRWGMEKLPERLKPLARTIATEAIGHEAARRLGLASTGSCE